MDWQQLLSPKKFQIREGVIQGYTPENVDDTSRSAYLQDYDRVIFSRSFRRLGRKTQVHPMAVNDHTHNRLTHSVEVSTVGRSIGQKIADRLVAKQQLSEAQKHDISNIIQVACLAHDMGNPPFGHIGEDALRTWFQEDAHQIYLAGLSFTEKQDLQTYEGNAHTLRIVCTTEMYKNTGGMRLSCASIGALLKYPWTSTAAANTQGKFNIYQSELPYFKAVAQELGLTEKVKDQVWCRHPLSYIMEAADDICYSILDLEDAVEMGIISMDAFQSFFPEEQYQAPSDFSKNQTCSFIRSRFIGECINFVTEQFLMHEAVIMAGQFEKKDFFADAEHPVAIKLNQLKAFAARAIYSHPTKLRKEIGAYPCLHHLLSVLIPAVHEWHNKRHTGGRVSHRTGMILKLLDTQPSPHDSLYQSYLEVLDFIGGMTDNYALNLASEIHGLKGL